MSKNASLSTKQRRAINAILSERTLTDAAKVAGVNIKTLERWMTDPTFKRELQVAEGELLDATVRRLTSISTLAVGVLESTMRSASTDTLRLRAADIALSRLMPLKELQDLATRISALEEVNAKKSTGTPRID